MSVTHVNRRGHPYHLLQGKTRKGKPKFYFSKKSGENAAEEIPAGYEIYEKPDTAVVYLRKPIKSRITAAEIEFARQLLAEHAGLPHTLVDVDEDSLIVYGAEDSELRTLASVLRSGSQLSAREEAWLRRQLHFQPLLRFALADEKERLFSAQRWCYLGLTEHWISAGFVSALPLDTLITSLSPRLGQESFYDLF